MMITGSGLFLGVLVLGMILLIYLVLFVLTVWFRALTSVMATEDDQFPARHDKVLWVVLFLCAPIFAPFVYTACVERFNKKKTAR